ncbi:IclR family transcriptional regulator [Streptomyces sp. NPDC002143]
MDKRVMADPSISSSRGESPSILTKAFDVLRAFNSHERVMTLSELSRASGLPKSTVHRLLLRLVDLGAVEHQRNGYKIGIDLYQMAASTPVAVLRDLSLPRLAMLSRSTGRTVLLACLREFDAFYLEKLTAPGAPRVLAATGTRLPANCTAVGKAMLAHKEPGELAELLPARLSALTPRSVTSADDLRAQLDGIRDAGISHERDEAQLGLSGLAAPIVVGGVAMGAVGIAFRSGPAAGTAVETALRETAAQLAKDVRGALSGGLTHWSPWDV